MKLWTELLGRRCLKARWLGGLVAVAAIAMSSAPAAAIDTVWAGAGPMQVTILRIENGKLVYQTKTGNPGERDLERVDKINAEGEAALNEAEDAFEAKKWDVAAKAYERAANSPKDWVKDRSANRLVAAARQSNNFPAMSAAFGILAVRDPTRAPQFRPTVVSDKAQVAAAIPGIQNALRAKPTSDLLKGFLAELYIVNGELPKAKTLLAGSKTAELLAPLAKLQVGEKDYAGALATIENNRALFTTPELQADALFALAEAKAGLAGADPAKKQDAALAYMRVVAHFGTTHSPLVMRSLMRTAALLEEMNQFAEAVAVTQQVIEEYNVPEAQALKPKLAELQKKVPAPGK